MAPPLTRRRARTKNPQYALKDVDPIEDPPTTAEPPIVQSVFEHGSNSKEAAGNDEVEEIPEESGNSEEEDNEVEGTQEEDAEEEKEDGENHGFGSNDGEGSDGSEDSISMDSLQDDTPLEPESMHFKHTYYTRQIKVQSRCFIKETVADINAILKPKEKRWFHEHPQFKHFFHMHLEKTHKVMGMWMLFLHTANLASRRQAWFIVNSVPIRYTDSFLVYIRKPSAASKSPYVLMMPNKKRNKAAEKKD